MIKEEFIEKTRKFLHRELSYDGEADTICPHCGKVISEGTKYLYHYESMAGNLCIHLGLTGKLADATRSYFVDHEYDFVTGHRGEDAKNLSQDLYAYLYD